MSQELRAALEEQRAFLASQKRSLLREAGRVEKRLKELEAVLKESSPASSQGA